MLTARKAAVWGGQHVIGTTNSVGLEDQLASLASSLRVKATAHRKACLVRQLSPAAIQLTVHARRRLGIRWFEYTQQWPAVSTSEMLRTLEAWQRLPSPAIQVLSLTFCR